MPGEADLGSRSDSASPGSRVSARRVVDRLDEADCMELLGNRGFGRLIYNSRYGPMTLPVVYTIHEELIVFRAWDVAAPRAAAVVDRRAQRSCQRDARPGLKAHQSLPDRPQCPVQPKVARSGALTCASQCSS